MGDLLFKLAFYKEAISCYKAVYNSTKVLFCYKELLKITPKDAELKIEQGDYLLSISYDKVTKHYHQAFSMSNNLELKANAWSKIAERIAKKGEVEKAREFTSRAESKNFIKSEEIDLIKIEQVAKTISVVIINDKNLSSSSNRNSETDEREVIGDKPEQSDNKPSNQFDELVKKVIILQNIVNEDEKKITKLEETVAIISEQNKKSDQVIKHQEALFERLEQIFADSSNSGLFNASGLFSMQNQTEQNSASQENVLPIGANQNTDTGYSN